MEKGSSPRSIRLHSLGYTESRPSLILHPILHVTVLVEAFSRKVSRMWFLA